MAIKLLSFFIDNNTPVFAGKKQQIDISIHRSITKGNTTNELLINTPNHIGTHIDFPKHFSNDGKSNESYSADFWFFNNIGFLNCSINDFISEIDNLDKKIEILIWRSGFGKFRGSETYWKEQSVIPSYFADILKNKFKELRVFGFDMISLTSLNDKEEGKKAHFEFLIKNEILIIEDMDLENVTSVPNRILVSPWQIRDADGVPCSVYGFFD
jgi:arylformamidase